MSSNTPIEPDQPEYLSQASAPSKSRTKPALFAGIGVLAAGAVGVGAWGVAQLTGGGPGAAQVLPADTLVYAAVDLDPSAGQKIEAIKTLKKFPALADELDLDSQDDVRKFIVEKLQENDECSGLDYSEDIEPWVGNKAAFALLPNDKQDFDVVFAVQVSDEKKAEDGVATIFDKCDGSDDYGVSFLDGYMVVAETDDVAKAATAAAAKSSLADDENYQKALDTVGDQGVVTVYLSHDGPKAIYQSTVGPLAGVCNFNPDADDDTGGQGLIGGIDDACSEITDSDAESQLDVALKDFTGAAATIRFNDGGVELAVGGNGLPVSGSDGDTPSLGDLPESTIAALGLALPQAWVDDIESQLKDTLGEDTYEEGLAQLEAESGLNLPEDVETLLTGGAVLALDGSTDFENFASTADPSELKLGLRLGAEEDDVRRILQALLQAAGAPPGEEDFVKLVAKDGQVAVGFDEDYLNDLLDGGDLGGESAFSKAVAEADKANVALFVDFDAADHWLDNLAEDMSGGDEDVVDNLKPLRALGASAWVDGDDSHFVLRLATD